MISMPRHSHTMLALCAVLLAASACQRTPDDAAATATPPPADASARPVSPPPVGAPGGGTAALPTDVISEVDNSSGPTGVDARALAGRFRGTVPCADCPGIDTTLDLRADGTYALSETYRERDVAVRNGSGTWTAENGGKRLRLDPNGKDDSDRLYGIASNDELVMLDEDGNPPDSALDYSLRRNGPGR